MEFAVAPAHRAHATASKRAAVTPAADEEAQAQAVQQLRAHYQLAIEAQARGDVSDAESQYRRVLAHALLAAEPLHLAAAQIVRARSGEALDESSTRALATRLTLRFLTLKNLARASETLAGSAGHDTIDAAACEHLQQALQADLAALDTGLVLAQLQEKLRVEHARAESGAAPVADGDEHKSSHRELSSAPVDDVPLWLHTARTAMQLGQMSVARRACESALKLRADSWLVIESMIDVLWMMSDHRALHTVLQHALSLDPWHTSSLLLQQRLWKMGVPQVPSQLTNEVALVEARIRELPEGDVQKCEQHLDALQRQSQQRLMPAAESSLLLRRWDCTVHPPSFSRLVQQVVQLYAELAEIVPMETAVTQTCSVDTNRIAKQQPVTSPGGLLTPVCFTLVELKPVEPAAVSDAPAPMDIDADDSAAVPEPEPSAALDDTPAAARVPMREDLCLLGDEPVPGTFTFVDPQAEAADGAADLSSAASSPRSLRATPTHRPHAAVLRQKQQQRTLVLDLLRLGWTNMLDKRVDDSISVDPLCFNMHIAGEAPGKDERGAAAASAVSVFSGGEAAPAVAHSSAEESEQVTEFLRRHAFASVDASGSGTVDSCSDVLSLALSLLQYLHAQPHVLVDNVAMLCLVQMLLANGRLQSSDPNDTHPSAAHLSLWLFCAEIAHEAHRAVHPTQLCNAMRPAAPASAGDAVIDLTAAGSSPSPPPALFRAPRRWKTHMPSAWAVSDQCVSFCLLASLSDDLPDGAQRDVFSSVEMQLRWQWLLAQRAVPAAGSLPDAVQTACAHLHSALALFSQHLAVASVPLPHLHAQGALTQERVEQALASLHVATLITDASQAHAAGERRTVLRILGKLLMDAATATRNDTELDRLPVRERDSVLRLFHAAADAEREQVALLLHSILSLRYRCVHALSLLHGKVPISRDDKQQAYDALDRVWSAWRKVGLELMDQLLLAMYDARRANAGPTLSRTESLFDPTHVFSITLFRRLQSDIGICLALALRGNLLSTAKETACQAMKLCMNVGLSLCQAQLRSEHPRMHQRTQQLCVQRHELLFVAAIHRVMAAHDICGESCGKVFIRTFLHRMYESTAAAESTNHLLTPAKDGIKIKLMGECTMTPTGPVVQAGPPLEAVSYDNIATVPFDTYERMSALAVLASQALLEPPFFTQPVTRSSQDGAGRHAAADVDGVQFRTVLAECRSLLSSETGQCLSCLLGLMKKAHASHSGTPTEFSLPNTAPPARPSPQAAAAEQILRERIFSFLLVHYREQLHSIHATLQRWYAAKAQRESRPKLRNKRLKVAGGAASDANADEDEDVSDDSSATSSALDEPAPEVDHYDILRVDLWATLDVLERPLSGLRLRPDHVVFIEQYLSCEPTAASMSDSMRVVMARASLPPDDDDWAERLYRLYLGVVLPAFLQRTEDPSHVSLRTSKDTRSMEESLLRVTRFELLSDACNVVCWSGMAFIFWNRCMEELFTNSVYAELALMRLSLAAGNGTDDANHAALWPGALLGAPLLRTRHSACKTAVSKWIDDFFKFYKCALLTLHLLHTQHGVGIIRAEAGPDTMPSLCCSSPLTLQALPVEQAGSIDPARVHAHLTVEVWEKLGSAVWLAQQLVDTLAAHESQDSSASASSAASAAASRSTDVAYSSLAQFLRQAEVDGTKFSLRCWQSASRLYPNNGLLKLMMAAAAAKLKHPAEEQVSLLSAAVQLSDLPRPNAASSSRKRALEEQGEQEKKESKDADEDAESAAPQSSAVGVRALFTLHATRLRLLREAQQNGPHADTSQRGSLLHLLERCSFDEWVRTGRVLQPVEAGAQEHDVRSVAAVQLDIANAMRYCLHLQPHCSRALVCLAELCESELAAGDPDAASRSLVDQHHTFVVSSLRKLLHAYPKTRNLASFPGGQMSSTHAPIVGRTPHIAAWWQTSPWTSVGNYFRCLDGYMQLLVRSSNYTAMLELMPLLTSGRTGDSLAECARVLLYGTSFLRLLTLDLTNAVPRLPAGDADLVFNRACRVCMLLFEQSVPLRELMLACYRMAMRMEGNAHTDDDMTQVHAWISRQRWARSIGRYDLLLGVASEGRKKRRSSTWKDEEAEQQTTAAADDTASSSTVPAAANSASVAEAEDVIDLT